MIGRVVEGYLDRMTGAQDTHDIHAYTIVRRAVGVASRISASQSPAAAMPTQAQVTAVFGIVPMS